MTRENSDENHIDMVMYTLTSQEEVEIFMNDC